MVEFSEEELIILVLLLDEEVNKFKTIPKNKKELRVHGHQNEKKTEGEYTLHNYCWWTNEYFGMFQYSIS